MKVAFLHWSDCHAELECFGWGDVTGLFHRPLWNWACLFELYTRCSPSAMPKLLPQLYTQTTIQHIKADSFDQHKYKLTYVIIIFVYRSLLSFVDEA